MFVKNKILKAIVLGTFSFSAITYAADYPVEVNSLHYAVSINKTSYVESLILEEPNLVAQFNKDGLTPIHVAIDSNSLSSLKVLLENKTNPNIKNAFDETPLVYAIKKNKLAYAKELLKYKANPKIEDSKGFNALYYAKKAGKDFENIFIEKKAAVSNLNSNLNKDTKDTLMAAQQKQLKKFEQKLQLELDKKINTQNQKINKELEILKGQVGSLNVKINDSYLKITELKEELKLTDLNQFDSDEKLNLIDEKVEDILKNFISFENALKQIDKKIEQADQKAMLSLYSKDTDEESVEFLKLGENSSTIEVQEVENVEAVTFGKPTEVEIVDEDNSLDF